MLHCNLCNYSNEKNKNYIKHCNTISHLEKEKISFICIVCNKKFKTLCSYKKHKLSLQHKLANWGLCLNKLQA